jgi:hypothetical protein
MTVLELALTVAEKCDAAFGEHTRPERCPWCHNGVHNHTGPCGDCRCADCRPAGIAGSPIYTEAGAR